MGRRAATGRWGRRVSDDPTIRIPVVMQRREVPRWILPALAVAYAAAGAVLTTGCLVLAHAADQIANTPFCRRL